MKLTPINGNTETEGTEYVYRGITLIVARAGNTEFKKAFRVEMKPYEDEIESGRIPEEKSRELMVRCVAKTILVGWKDFVDVDGEEWEYSEENAISLLTDDNDCYEAISVFSSNIENYLTKSQENLKAK